MTAAKDELRLGTNLNNNTIELDSLSLSTPYVVLFLTDQRTNTHFVDLLSVGDVKLKEMYDELKKWLALRI